MAAKKKSVTDIAYDKLLEMIISGELEAGKKIPPENELKDIFNVSRNTIRTVLNRLNVLGVLETRRGEGTYVKQMGAEIPFNTFLPPALMSTHNLLDIIEFRKGVEIESARLAAIHATEEDIKALKRCLRSVDKNLKDPVKEEADSHYAYSTMDFHLQIAIASKNELFAKLLELIKYMISTRMYGFLEYESNVTDSRFYHKLIFECIVNKKPDEAAFLMERHMVLLIQHVGEYSKYINEQQVASN